MSKDKPMPTTLDDALAEIRALRKRFANKNALPAARRLRTIADGKCWKCGRARDTPSECRATATMCGDCGWIHKVKNCERAERNAVKA